MANSKIIERKKEVVNEIASKVKESSSVILFEYRGLSVSEMTELRKNLRNNLKEYNLEKIEEILKKHNKDLTTRAETLDLDIFIDIANNI